MRLIRRILYFFQQRREAAALAEEMEFHRQMAEQEHGDRHAASRQMGNTLMAQEDARAVWLPVWLESIIQDLRYAWRSLRAKPGFTLLALLALGLGIGLNTCLFTAFNAVALRPWPVREPGRVVNLLVTEPSAEKSYGGFSRGEYLYLRSYSKQLSGAIFMRNERVNLDQQANGSRSIAHFVSGNYFDVLGVDMARGRPFSDEEDRVETPAAVAVLSYRCWQTRYAGDNAIIGRRILINEAPFTVIGVAAESFTGLSPDAHDLWAPVSSLPLIVPKETWAKDMLTKADWCCSNMAGRLAPGATRASAAAELTTLSAQFQRQRHEKTHEIVAVGTAFFGRPDAKRQILPIMGLIFTAVGAVLLLACANVSNLLLARAQARSQEIAVRLAIGAGRARLIRQLLTESLLLSFIAAGIGLILAYGLPGSVLSYFAEQETSVRLQPDLTVLAFTIAVSMLAAVAFGLAPALRGTRISVGEAMKLRSQHSSPRFPLRGVLLGIQVAISVVLLAGAAMIVRGLAHVRDLDPGFRVDGVSVLATELPPAAYNDARGRIYFHDLTERIEAMSPAGKVGLSEIAPLGNTHMFTGFTMPGRENRDRNLLAFQRVNAAFFDVMDIPIVAGRNFIPSDVANGGIIVNEAMAKRFWPGASPVGQAINTNKRREIVGVVRDSQIYGLGPVEPIMFEPFEGGQHSVIVLRTSGAGQAWSKQLVALSTQLEPKAISTVSTMHEQMERWLVPMRSSALIAAVLGALALLLATIGVYGVIAYSVEQRRKEIGIRMALGAKPEQIIRFMARSNSRAVLGGLCVGLLLSGGVAELLRSQLFGIQRLDPVVYGGVLMILAVAGVAASVVPAVRAVRTDPLTVLHYE